MFLSFNYKHFAVIYIYDWISPKLILQRVAVWNDMEKYLQVENV